MEGAARAVHLYRVERNLSRTFQVLGNIVGRRTPYVHQWLFNIQRQLTADIDARNWLSGERRPQTRAIPTYNQAVLKTGPTDSRSIAQRRPWPAYDRIQQVDGSVNSNYHALAAKSSSDSAAV